VRVELCAEAIRLGKLVCVLMPDEPEALGLLAVMLLQDSRRDARVAPDGSVILLADQDRAMWDATEIAEGVRLLDRAIAHGRPGAYQLQAVIAAGHARGAPPQTIADAYARLELFDPSPVVRLNRGVAVALAGDVEAGLALVDSSEGLQDYHYLHGARADLLRRLGRTGEAEKAYRRAHSLTANAAERGFYEQRLDELRSAL
jgi:predicted RNA polymerase sigma factor